MHTQLTASLAASLSQRGSGAHIDIDAALRLAGAHPFDVLPAVALLHGCNDCLDPATRQRLMQQIALNSPQPQRMFMLADVECSELVQFYPPAPRPDTTDTISRFLDTYGHSSPAEDALLEKLIFNPTPDYSTMLAREAETCLTPASRQTGASEQDDLINSFILKHAGGGETSLLPHTDSPAAPAPEKPGPQPGPAKTVVTEPSAHPTPLHKAVSRPVEPVAPATVPESSLSESLAKTYIRQKRYEKAFEIIHTLSLNNPEKNAYFADQLRFLRKLMLNRSHAQGQQPDGPK